MAIIMQTVTLDPAFLQEIKRDDQRLKLLLHRFRQFVFGGRVAESSRQRLADIVREVRDRLAFHFALEEAYGYFEDPIVVAPRLCDRVETLRSEHGELYGEIAAIADVFEDLDSCMPVELGTIQDRCREFLRRFDLHEAAENALIVQAFNEDIGDGD